MHFHRAASLHVLGPHPFGDLLLRRGSNEICVLPLKALHLSKWQRSKFTRDLKSWPIASVYSMSSLTSWDRGCFLNYYLHTCSEISKVKQ